MSKRTFSFGKVDYIKSGRKNCPVEVTIELRKEKNGEYEFSACGDIWNHIHSDIYCGGQCLDTIAKYVKNDPIFNEILDLWKNFHLNGLKTRTHRQIALLKEETKRRNAEHKAKGEPEETPLNYASRYDDACEFLKSIDAYFDKLADNEVLDCESNGNTREHYGYGTGWLTWTLDDNALNRIQSLIHEGTVWKGGSKMKQYR